MPTPTSAITNAKLALGWGEKSADYRRWRRIMKAYYTTNNIKSRSDASRQEWKNARDHGMKVEHGFPQSGLDLLSRNTAAAEKAKDHLNNLLLDCLKKTRETETREDLATAGRRQAEVDVEVDDAVDRTPSSNRIVRVYISDPNVAASKAPDGKYLWATCPKSQLVKLKNITLAELHKGIQTRLQNGKIHSIYGALEKPPADGSLPSDVERICTDEDLENFLDVTHGSYSPVCFQVQVHKTGGGAVTPAPDERSYFLETMFDGADAGAAAGAELYDPAVEDSDQDQYLIAKGKRKKLAWPRTDVRFETQKAKTRKRIRRMKAHLQQLKTKHTQHMGADSGIIDYETDEHIPFYYCKYLNPQSGADYIKARDAATQAAVVHKATNGNTAAKRTAGKAKALEVWGGPVGDGDFNV